jgi:cold-inducible RNA-binding protein
MSKSIYVGNLSFQTTEDDLSALFEPIGQITSVKIITDRDTGQSKGFAFVEMGDEDADQAIARYGSRRPHADRKRRSPARTARWCWRRSW